MSNNFELMGLFSIPIIKIKFKDHYKYNFSEVEKRDEKPDDWIAPVHTSFPVISDDDLIVPPMVRDSLNKDLVECVKEVIGKLKMPTNIEINQLWYNIYHDGQGQEPHRHLPMVGGTLTYWSGIYYNKNASPTKFHRDDKLFQTQIFPGYEKSVMDSFLSTAFSPPVEDGDILLFPPYLRHSATSLSHHRYQMRMTFSFNIDLKR